MIPVLVRLLEWAIILAAVVAAIAVLTIAAVLEHTPALPDTRQRKGGCMALTSAAVLLLLALVFLVVSALKPFPIWPAVLCLILERGIALGWR